MSKILHERKGKEVLKLIGTETYIMGGNCKCTLCIFIKLNIDFVIGIKMCIGMSFRSRRR